MPLKKLHISYITWSLWVTSKLVPLPCFPHTLRSPGISFHNVLHLRYDFHHHCCHRNLTSLKIQAKTYFLYTTSLIESPPRWSVCSLHLIPSVLIQNFQATNIFQEPGNRDIKIRHSLFKAFYKKKIILIIPSTILHYVL